MHSRSHTSSALAFLAPIGLLLAIGPLAAPAEAVDFRITDGVVDPGQNTTLVELIIDPKDAVIDGFQFGIDISGAAEITGISESGNFLRIVGTREPGRDLPGVSTTSTQVGSGINFILDIDDDDLARFSGPSPFPVAEIFIAFTSPPGEKGSYTVSLTSSLGEAPVAVGYTTGATLHTTGITTTDGTIRVSDREVDFTPSSGDIFSGKSWSSGSEPFESDRLFVRNGGTADATSGTLAARSLRLGDFGAFSKGGFGGDGIADLADTTVRLTEQLEAGGRSSEPIVQNDDIFGVLSLVGGSGLEAEGISVAHLPIVSDTTVAGEGVLVAGLIDQVLARGSLYIGKVSLLANDGSAPMSAETTSFSFLENVDSVVIGQDLEVANIVGSSAHTDTAVSTSAMIEWEEIGELLVGANFDLITRQCSSFNTNAGSRQMGATMTLSNIGSLRVGDDFQMTDGRSCRGTETYTATLTAELTDIAEIVVGRDFEVPRMVWNAGSTNLQATLDLIRVDHLDVQGNFQVGTALGGDQMGSLVTDHTVTLMDVPVVDVAGELGVGVLYSDEQPDAAASTDISAALHISDAAVAVGEGVMVGGVARFGNIVGGAPDPLSGLDVSGNLILSRSALETPAIWLGALSAFISANPSGRLSLSGFLDTTALEVWPSGALVLQVEGDEPASAATVGQARAARIATDDATLQGAVEVEVLYNPTLGVHTYDLIVAPAGTLADTTGTLSVTQLPDGVVERSLQIVTEGGFDILRLEIESFILFADGFESGNTEAWTSSS